MIHNPFPRLAGARRWLAMLLGAALIALASVAHAAEPAAEASPEDLGKLFAYTGCAVSIAVASTTGQIYMAVFGCARVFLDEVDW